MKIAFLIAGIVLFVSGLLTVGYGIQLELSFGNTLISTGAVMACTGVIVVGLWAVLGELTEISRRLGPAARVAVGTGREKEASIADQATTNTKIYDQLEGRRAPARQETDPRDRGRSQKSSMSDVDESPPKPRRHLLFSSSRTEREQGRSPNPTPPGFGSDVQTPVPEVDDTAPGGFQDAGSTFERTRSAHSVSPRRWERTPPTLSEEASEDDGTLSTSGGEQPLPVTVLKSGVVDGMAYSLFSDGSIEAQMPEGMMRFASIEELRAHLDQRS